MNCINEIQHIVRYGDTVYRLAQYYNTTVEEIIANNRNVNPYNLQIGSVLKICPNTIYQPDNDMCITQKELDLSDEMNTIWEQHVFWTRLLLISIASNLNDLKPTENRLLRNPKDLANIFRRYYGNEIANRIENLFTEHLKIGGDIIVALKNGENDKAGILDTQWHKNADDIADEFSRINPYYNRQKVQQMLYQHLDLTTQEVKARLKGDYVADIDAFDKVEKEALMMARYFTNGIIEQFPNMF